MRFEVATVDLPLRKPFAIAKGSALVKRNVLAIIDGRFCGEGAGSVAYGPFAPEIEADLLNGAESIQSESALTRETLDKISSLPINPASRAALMGSAINYLSAQSGCAPWEIFGLHSPTAIRTSFTFALDDPLATHKQIVNSPFTIIKVKMGDERDNALLEMLGRITGKEIRVDANGGWSPARAEEMIARLAVIGVNLIEQPTAPEFVADWQSLKPRNSRVELFMDEGMNTLADVERLSIYCDGINIKMAKCGGLTEGIRMTHAARRAGRKVMLGCMVESSIGIAQAYYMSSLADYFDLDGPLLLETDIASGLKYQGDLLTADGDLIGGPRLTERMALR